MAVPVFMGNEVMVAGYRLAGAQAYASQPESAGTLFEQLLAQQPPLILLGESCIAGIGAARVYAAVSRAHPPVLVVADRVGQTRADDLPASILSALGVAG